MESALYARMGVAYTDPRRADARIAHAIRTALGDAASVVNIGAGSGSYEPTDLQLIPVEPSETMIAAYWRRPDAYLDEAARANVSTFALLDERVIAAGVASLRRCRYGPRIRQPESGSRSGASSGCSRCGS